MKIGIILGTRPEIIKMSPIIKECAKRKLNFFVLHTNQHYSKNLDEIFFDDLELPRASYNLNVGSGTHGEEISKMLFGIEKILIKEKPDIVLVQGDTNTVLAGALAASKLQIKIGHIEAGLRSYFKEMPEEVNRILTDHCSDFLFAPTKKAGQILINEGIPKSKIFVVGNTIMEVVYKNSKLAEGKSKILSKLDLRTKKYCLLTIHRQENVDKKERFKKILQGLDLVYKKHGLIMVFPVHPRTEKILKEFNLKVPEGIKIIKPVGYLDFLKLESSARVILTDSGGIQEEACILKVPCVTLRDNTERPETLQVGSNILVGVEPKTILKYFSKMMHKKRIWGNPFGDGTSAEKIIKIIINEP